MKQAAIIVPDPGKIQLNIHEITAHTLPTNGTFVIFSHKSRSVSPILTTLFRRWCDNWF